MSTKRRRTLDEIISWFYTVSMLYSLSGAVTHINDDFFVLETAGIGFKIRGTNSLNIEARNKKTLKIFCHMQIEQGEIYGFENQEELSLFETLLTVSGIGPKMGIKLINSMPATQLASLILLEKRDELSKQSGVSTKVSSKIIIELKEKLKKSSFADSTDTKTSFELQELLRMLGYAKADIESVCSKIDTSTGKIENHLKSALSQLSSHKIRQN